MPGGSYRVQGRDVMSARIIHLADYKARRGLVPGETPAIETAPDLAERFHFWTGGSGRRYVHTVYSLIECPPMSAGNYILVRRDGEGRRSAALDRAQLPSGADAEPRRDPPARRRARRQRGARASARQLGRAERARGGRPAHRPVPGAARREFALRRPAAPGGTARGAGCARPPTPPPGCRGAQSAACRLRGAGADRRSASAR